VLSLHGAGAAAAFRLNADGTAFLADLAGAPQDPAGSPWTGRRRAGDSTIDLRLD
jgi:hypothetical protein